MKTDAASDAVVEPEDVVTDPDFIEPAPTRIPSQLWQPWTLIVPAILIIPLLCLAFAGQISPTSDEVLLQKRHRTTEPATEPAPQVSQAAAPMIFVPGDDEKLHAQPANIAVHFEEGKAPTASTTIQSIEAMAALRQLFAAAPNYFPKGGEVQDVRLEQAESGNAIAHVSLNDAFWNSDYWSMDTRTVLATEAIAHTVRSAYRIDFDNVQVLLLRDGHAVSVLGEMDMADPITPDESLVAAP